MTAAAFWAATWREVVEEIAVARERAEAEVERDIRHAWWTVRLYAEFRTKRLPPLQKVLGKTPATAAPRRQTVDQQRRMLHYLSRLYGGKVTRGHAQ